MSDLSAPAPRRRLSLIDTTSIIIGIVVGAAIYETTPLIARSVGSPLGLCGGWLLGGFFALLGAVCYGELATAYPRDGGDYVYLSRGFGRPVGFLFSWAQFWIVRPGSLGAMAYIFARYAHQLLPIGGRGFSLAVYAVASITLLTLLNVLGVRQGRATQNLLTAAKLGGLTAIVAAALLVPAGAPEIAGPSPMQTDLSLALILIMFAYGGWNDMSYVAAEVRRPERNVVAALLLGTTGVVVLYVAVSMAMVRLLGFEGLRDAPAVAASAVRPVMGELGARFMSALICISCLGAMQGMIFTGARIYYATGIEHPLFAWIGAWNRRFDTPARSLVVQAIATLGAVLSFGRGADVAGFQRMVIFTAPVFWIFMLLVSISVLVLRRRDPDIPRPFLVPGYPVTPILFALVNVFMLWATLEYAWRNRSVEAFWSVGILALGAGVAAVDSRR